MGSRWWENVEENMRLVLESTGMAWREAVVKELASEASNGGFQSCNSISAAGFREAGPSGMPLATRPLKLKSAPSKLPLSEGQRQRERAMMSSPPGLETSEELSQGAEVDRWNDRGIDWKSTGSTAAKM